MTRPCLGVAIDAPLRRLFDYLPPRELPAGGLQIGQRLRVPFGRRRVVGVLVELRDRSEVPLERLRPALEVLDDPPFEPALFELLLWAADYYHHPVGEVLAAALPVALRQGAPVTATTEWWQLTEAGRAAAARAVLPARAVRLRSVLSTLSAGEAVPATALESASAHWRAAVRDLERRGWVERFDAPAIPLPRERAERSRAGELVLSGAQSQAVDAIVAALGTPAHFLLHGVTGSGKTEVYLRAIAAAVAADRQALVLVPEIALTPQLVRRFEARFSDPIAVLHSGLTDADRLHGWRAAREGRARIVIGTRSAIFTPLARPGLVIVDEEHDPSYKQQDGFRYSARDLAIARAQRQSVPVVLGSATPSLESLGRVAKGQATRLSLPQRAGGAEPPRSALIDLRHHGAEQGLSTPALMAVRRHLDAGGQVLLYLNRRGYAPVLFCAECGWAAPCRRCDARMTVHRGAGRLTCHHCGLETQIPATCPVCAAPTRPVGQGTERIEETVARLFPAVPLARLDRDAVRRRGELEETLDRVDSGTARILIGTQMLTKGHHFPGVTLVVVLNADQGLFSADFRASERLAQSIVQVAGRAGRAERPGEVLIQTAYPEHPLLEKLLRGGYEAFAEAALTEREQAGWPPATRLALFRAEAVSAATAEAFLTTVRDICAAQATPGLTLLGPAPAPMERRAGRHRAQLLLRAPTYAPLKRTLRHGLQRIEALPAGRRVRWSLDVDPIELF